MRSGTRRRSIMWRRKRRERQRYIPVCSSSPKSNDSSPGMRWGIFLWYGKDDFKRPEREDGK